MPTESLAYLVELAKTQIISIEAALREKNWTLAHALSRSVLANGSKLHSRLTGIVEASELMKEE